MASYEVAGDLCSGLAPLLQEMQAFLNWSLTLDSSWGGLVFVTPAHSNLTNCSATYSLLIHYVYQGSNTSAAFQASYAHVPWMQVATYPDAWSFYQTLPREVIIPAPWTPAGVPSVFVPRDGVAMFADLVARNLAACVPVGTCAQVGLLYFTFKMICLKTHFCHPNSAFAFFLSSSSSSPPPPPTHIHIYVRFYSIFILTESDSIVPRHYG